jgi:hypothetical protein
MILTSPINMLFKNYLYFQLGIYDAVGSKSKASTLIAVDENDKRNRTDSTASLYQTMNIDDLLNLLKETKSVHDEADILHYLFEIK